MTEFIAVIWRKVIAVIDATFAVAKRKFEKSSGLYGIRTLDICDTGAALNWALHRYRRGLGFESRSSLNFFSGFLFVTAKVASTTVMIFYHIILHPAFYIYDFHIVITTGYCVESSIFCQLKDFHEWTSAPWIFAPPPSQSSSPCFKGRKGSYKKVSFLSGAESLREWNAEKLVLSISWFVVTG